MSSITRFTQSTALTQTTAAPDSSLSTAGTEWSGRVLTFDDLPPEAARELAPDSGVLAETVVALEGVTVSRAGGAHQTRLAFRSYADRIIVLTVTRSVAERADGRYAPTARWTISDHQLLKTAAGTVATRRTGVVAPGRLINEPSEISAGPAPARAHESALHAESYLPATVRYRLAHELPNPATHLGQLIRWAKASGAEQEVVVLRHSGGAKAIILRSTRPDKPTAKWTVTQWAYDLRGSNHALTA